MEDALCVAMGWGLLAPAAGAPHSCARWGVEKRDEHGEHRPGGAAHAANMDSTRMQQTWIACARSKHG
eukprot:1152634-Pelagomonas_calceolata.AAC.3